jgi:dolichol-phosphate mannosyltransferase
MIYQQDSKWWLAGLSGALIGSVWNFAVSAAFVWPQR